MGWHTYSLRLVLALGLLFVTLTPAFILTPGSVRARSIERKVLPSLVAPTAVLPALNPKQPVAPPEFEPGQILVKFDGPDQAALQNALTKPAFRNFPVSKIKLEVADTGLYRLYLAPSANLSAFIQLLQHQPGVVYAEPNYIYHLLDLSPNGLTSPTFPNQSNGLKPRLDTNDPLRPNQYYLDTVSVPAAWNLTTGSNLIIAVEDSGIRFDHPDLVGRIRGDGYNFVADSSDVTDDLGHGTEVTGLIAANSNNKQGIAGINWAAQILPVKIANAQGSIDASAAVAGIYYAVRHGAKALNLSYGGEVSSQALSVAVGYALDNGVTVVAAAGNAPDGAVEYPAAYPGVIAVAATDASDQLAFFDSYGSYVSLSAPGQDILTTGLNKNNSGDYAIHSGTSFSSPIVCGVVSLMLSLNPYLRPSQILYALIQTTDKIYPADPVYYANYGTGRLNALHALQFVAAFSVVPPPQVSLARLIFSQQISPNQTLAPGDSLTLNGVATNLGSGSASAAYLTVPNDPNLSLQYVQTQPFNKSEWVTSVFNDHFKLALGPLPPAATVTFTAVYKLNITATLGTKLIFQETGSWSDTGTGGASMGNPLTITVAASSSQRASNLGLSEISPNSGKSGQNFSVTATGFAANEPISAWLNLPDGSVEALPMLQADNKGLLIYLFSSSGQQQTGNYSLVTHGQASRLEDVAYFSLN